jgi:hypothetical protein
MTTKLLEHLGAIAIIGMAGRFPGARNVEQFRQNMENGVESVTFFSDEELLGQGVPPARLHDPNYVKAAPLLDDYDLFDAAFFEYSPPRSRTHGPAAPHFARMCVGSLGECGIRATQGGPSFLSVHRGLRGIRRSHEQLSAVGDALQPSLDRRYGQSGAYR